MKQFIGCSGFNYDDWKGRFYPEDTAKKRWLEYYAEHFNSVEINASFYRLPKQKTLKNWYERVPDSFRFTLKGSRYVTHAKKLNNPSDPVTTFYKRAEVLQDKLGCILWQLPGNLQKDMEKLKGFCSALSNNFRNVIEFRHSSWFDDEVYDVLSESRVAFCMLSAPDGLTTGAVQTSDIMYLRFHGKDDWYSYRYSDGELQHWANTVVRQSPREAYMYFNNDVDANAPDNAGKLQQLITAETA